MTVDYFNTVFGTATQTLVRTETVVDIRSLPAYGAPFYTALVNRLREHGFPIKPHQWKEGDMVCETIAANLTHGTLSWSSFDFDTQIRFTWTHE